MAVKIGEKAPEFTLRNQHGKLVSLKDFLGKTIVLYFYPKDDTPGCTAESCAFRDEYQVFQTAGVELIGVSGDSTRSHLEFGRKYQLPFTLLSDNGGKVRQLYGAMTAFGLFPGRVTYIINPEGIVQYVFDSMFNFKGHVEETLKQIQVSQS